MSKLATKLSVYRNGDLFHGTDNNKWYHQIFLSILFPIAPWAIIKTGSNRPPKVPIAPGEGATVKCTPSYMRILFWESGYICIICYVFRAASEVCEICARRVNCWRQKGRLRMLSDILRELRNLCQVKSSLDVLLRWRLGHMIGEHVSHCRNIFLNKLGPRKKLLFLLGISGNTEWKWWGWRFGEHDTPWYISFDIYQYVSFDTVFIIWDFWWLIFFFSLEMNNIILIFIYQGDGFPLV